MVNGMISTPPVTLLLNKPLWLRINLVQPCSNAGTMLQIMFERSFKQNLLLAIVFGTVVTFSNIMRMFLFGTGWTPGYPGYLQQDPSPLTSTTLLYANKTPESISVASRPHFIIHVGPHKTGSTSIQQSLKSCSEFALNKLNILVLPGEFISKNWQHNFPMHILEEGHPDYCNETINGPGGSFYRSLLDQNMYQRTWSRIQECHDSHLNGTACTVLASSELFASFEKVAWDYLLRRLKGWDVSVVMFHRKYDAVVASSYVEMHKRYQQRDPLPVSNFLSKNLERDIHHVMDHHDLVVSSFRDTCGRLDGPSHCQVQGVNYEDFLLNESMTPIEFLLYNTTNASRPGAENRSDVEEYRHMLRNGVCQTTMNANRSPGNGFVNVQLLAMASQRFSSKNCSNKFDLYVDDESVRTLLENKSFDDLPSSCWPLPKETADKEIRWDELHNDGQLSPGTISREVCSVLAPPRNPRSSKWYILTEILQLLPCDAPKHANGTDANSTNS